MKGKHFLFIIISVSLSILSLVLWDNNSALADVTPAFPGAEGFGADTIGGRGGDVYEVTNVNDSGSGSLRDCVEDVDNYGPRICIFKVGGLISIDSTLIITEPYLTIAGQTAPGGGITIKLGDSNEAFSTQTHDVIIRYITIRPGPGGSNHGNQIASEGTELYNIIIDHNSFSWGVDSNVETWYRVQNATIQWSVISEGLDCSTHDKGCHSKGMMIGGYSGNNDRDTLGSENISVLNNLMANNVDRNPLIQMCGPAQVINNVTYNASYTYSHQQLNCFGDGYEGTSYVNWINNYHKKGPSGSQTDLKIIPDDEGVCSSGKVYMDGNVGNNGAWTYEFNGSCASRGDIITGTPVAGPTVSTTTAIGAYNDIISSGGVGNSKAIDCNGDWINRRDSIDERVINDVINATGGIIDHPDDVGGWITPSTGTGCIDTDHDGMPDTWESNKGLNPSLYSDGSLYILDADYTNLEVFINGISPLGALISGSFPLISNTDESDNTVELLVVNEDKESILDNPSDISDIKGISDTNYSGDLISDRIGEAYKEVLQSYIFVIEWIYGIFGSVIK